MKQIRKKRKNRKQKMEEPKQKEADANEKVWTKKLEEGI